MTLIEAQLKVKYKTTTLAELVTMLDFDVHF